jgi:hypothetical protein
LLLDVKEVHPMSRHDKASDPESDAVLAKLLGIVNSSWMAQATCVAAELGIADLLASGPKTTDELARVSGCHAPSLHRLMRALTSLELCTEHKGGAFELTRLGALLRKDAPNSVRSWTIWWGKYLWPVWANLLYSVRFGTDARRLVVGTEGFDHLEQNAAMAATFHEAMVELTRLVGRDVSRSYDFSGIKQVVDVGGGYGELLAALLKAYPEMRGILFDLPHAVRGAKPHLDRLGVGDRCELIAGSFLELVPSGADAYLLKSVIHDWDDEHSGIILGNCRRAMPPGAKLLLVERLMPMHLEASARGQAMARADLNMLVTHGTRERTEAEFRRLLESQRFSLGRILPISSSLNVIEGIPC